MRGAVSFAACRGRWTGSFRAYDPTIFGEVGGGAATRPEKTPRPTDAARAATVMPVASARL